MTVQELADRIGETNDTKERLFNCLKEICQDFPEKEYSMEILGKRFLGFQKDKMTENEKLAALVRAAVEMTSKEGPKWENIGARLHYFKFSLNLEKQMSKLKIHSFYEKIVYLTEKQLYGDYILKSYSKAELEQAEEFIDERRNKLFNFSGLDLLLSRYVICSYDRKPLETPQEMYLGIALHLALKEKGDRMLWVKRFYQMLSCLEITMATPTLSNARKPFHQLSSCFIDVMPDSLEGIYRTIDNFAKVSKMGGGMGIYTGKVRAAGSSIRGFLGAAGGVIRWIRLINDTAVAVDQLGMRQGAAAVYLDIWHKDLPEFLQLRTNNGDERMKAHDIFPALCIPDLFWKMAEKDLNQEWHLFCPHEIMEAKGYCLEDCYGKLWEKRYMECVEDKNLSRRTLIIKDLVRMILKSAVETGTPFIFNRDLVNKGNPNSHKGMIYCSNLCTEIAQNMSPMETREEKTVEVDGETLVVTSVAAGDFVVCNLASISLGNIDLKGNRLEEVTAWAVRALDNVIDLNFYPLPYAKITSCKYRSIGLGVSGYHHMLAKEGIPWESEDHLRLADQVFQRINYAAIEASSDLGAEKGSYEYFTGSGWETGQYFETRNYTDYKWMRLREKVKSQGMRNGWLIAVAPTSSTSILAGTTAGIDPVMKKYFLEEKKHMMLPRVAPQLTGKTYWLYKEAHTIDQKYTIKAAGIRQRHIDQAQSLNLYITNSYTMRQVLDLYLTAWREGVKTIYYIRSKSLEVEECESCSS
ncbi:ribonucleoside-diphosphate reductase subunit alpha [Lachnoclostridium edouardi]|uniref:ribonucleoside-diphosphate reductase subunit alpha n=1 Tax=Lachnoclostridium edouardi TaxID=1926283 RepID=UPI002E8E40A9|nr:ribonucleoside-diphosphate reductase subunit alpha [Lachnoclostridium edouardi]